ncbi:MAG: MGMT family protein [Pseudomonadota bacterium]
MKAGKSLNPRKRPTQDRSRETVRAILEAAARVFGEKGLVGATTNRIAERAGVSIGTLYQYFPNKESIIHGLMEKHIREGWELISREMPEMESRGRLEPGMIRRLVVAMITLHRRDPALHRVLFEEVRLPRFMEGYRKNEEYAVRVLCGLLEKTPGTRNNRAETAARLLVHALESMTHRLVIYGYEGVEEAEFVEELTEMMSRYLLDRAPAERGEGGPDKGSCPQAEPEGGERTDNDPDDGLSPRRNIYKLVKAIPHGRVSTYGRVSKMVGRCTARMVGYAMAALPEGSDVPWHRVINREGRVSLRSGGDGDIIQRKLLELEGVTFDGQDRVDLEKYLWPGPSAADPGGPA